MEKVRVSISRALLALCACGLALAAAAPAAAQVEPNSTLFYSTADFSFKGKLWSVHGDGSDRRLLRSGVATGPGGVSAVLSRNGRRILCLCRGGEIDSMHLDGSRMRAIGKRPARTRYDYLVLGAGGEVLRDDERHNRLMMQPLGSGHQRVVGTPERGEYIESFAISPGGGKVGFAAGACGGGGCWENVWVQQVGSGKKTFVYRTPKQRTADSLQWSGDGKALAFIDSPEGEKGEEPADPHDHLMIYAGGTTTEFAVPAPASAFPPFFSPDRSVLALGSKPPGKIYAAASGDQAPQLITDTGCKANCLFAPSVFGWLPG